MATKNGFSLSVVSFVKRMPAFPICTRVFSCNFGLCRLKTTISAENGIAGFQGAVCSSALDAEKTDIKVWNSQKRKSRFIVSYFSTGQIGGAIAEPFGFTGTPGPIALVTVIPGGGSKISSLNRLRTSKRVAFSTTV